MLTLEIIGGSRIEQTLTAEAVTFAFNQLIPRIKNCTLNVYLVSSKQIINNNKQERIRINKNQTGDDFLTAVFHEMVHVKQYIRGELDQDSDDLNYFDRPSEIEAYRLQEELLEKWKSK